MKIKITKLLAALLLLTAIGFTINGCKKTDTAVNNTEAENAKAKAIQATIERYGRITAPVIYQPNKPAASISYLDKDGRLILLSGANNFTDATCGQYTCGTAPTAADLYVTSTLQYVKWYYKCGTGHDLTAIWDVSTPYSLLTQDPNNSSNYSYGNVRILNGGGTVLATSSNLGNGNLTIVNTGADPNCSSNTLYRVTYTWQNISATYFPGNYVECSFTIYNNCALTSNNTVVGYTTGVPYTNVYDVFTVPCDRTDQAFVNPNTGPNSEATIAGAYSICSPPSGFTGTTDHQIEYRLRTNGSSNLWDDQSSTVYWGSTGSSATPTASTMNSSAGLLYLHYMTPSSGTWLVRYRNRHSGCTPTISGTNDNWNNTSGNNNYVTEVWPL
jgi:hypothetical protein